MRKITTLIIFSMILFCAYGAPKVKDGTFTAKANAHNGPMEISVTFAKGKIKTVNIVSNFESVGVQSVLNTVPERIVKNQS